MKVIGSSSRSHERKRSTLQQHQVPQEDRVRVGEDLIIPATFVRNLGVYFDSDVSTRTPVSKTVSSCFAILYVTFVACVDPFRDRCLRRSWLHWSYRDLTTVMLRWPVYHVTSWTDRSPCLTPLHGSSSRPGNTTM